MGCQSANSKRKHGETVDLTADDSDDHAFKRQAQTPSSVGRTSSNIAGRPPYSSPAIARGGQSFSPSNQHSINERQEWLNEDEDDINAFVGSTQDGAEGQISFITMAM